MADSSLIDNLILTLQKCRRKRNLAYAKLVYAHICQNGLESHRAIGNYIVPVFVDCGSLFDAQQIFNRLVHRNVHSWTSLILGYIECGESQHALNLYQKMLEDSVHPSSYTLMALVKACARLEDVEKGRDIHGEITQKGFEGDLFVGSSLVDMYAKCASLLEAREIFDKLPVRNVVSWTALIAGYAEHGPCEEALTLFEQMQLEGIVPDTITFICALKACSSLGAIDMGREIHADIAQEGFESELLIGSTLVDMFAKCGSLTEAQEVFDRLPFRNVLSWTALIAGYSEHGPSQEGLRCFEQMQLEGIPPDAVTFVCILKACGSIGALDKGRELHAEITKRGFQRDVFVGSTLVDMYAKCVSLADASEVLVKLPVRNVVSWNALIAGYAEHGYGQEALTCFEEMQQECVSPDCVTFVCVLKACGSIGAIVKGQEVHNDITRNGFDRDIFVGNALVDMYAKCGCLLQACEVFDKLPARNVVSWNALIAGYAENGASQEALNCFDQMQLESLSPDVVTFVFVVKACGNIGEIIEGQKMHIDIAQRGYERNVFVGSALIDMYAKCGSLAEARKVFNMLPIRNVVSWNALITGYAEHGPDQEVLKCVEQMQQEGLPPDSVTFVCALKACGSLGAIGKGREIHADIMQKRFEVDFFVGSALIDMYVKFGSLAEAQGVFDRLPARNVVTWNALIAAYAEHGPCQEALKCFEQMQLEGIAPNIVAFVCILKACGNLGAVGKGREMHIDIIREGFERDLSIGNTLVDMYAKCGLLLEARDVFDSLYVRDVVSWNAMIKGYGLNQEGSMAVKCFDDMQEHGVKPDDIIFTCLLIACSRSRLVLKGQEVFNAMREDYGIVPTFDDFTCMVDLLAKSGFLIEAEKFLGSMPCPPAWRALLSACKFYGETDLGLRCFDQLVQMDPQCATPYVLMEKLYSSSGRWDDAYRIETLRKSVGAKKKPAIALIEVNEKVHEFIVGTSVSKEISAMLEILGSRMKEEGHVPDVNMVLRSIFEEEKSAIFCEQAQKLVIAFGLLNAP